MTHADAFLSDYDLYLFGEGRFQRAFEKLGAHLVSIGGQSGVKFAVWAPNAHYISVVGDFNDWDIGRNPLKSRGSSGVWEEFVPGAKAGDRYKFHIQSRHLGYSVDKADPFAFYAEQPPRTASVVHDIWNYTWGDDGWMKSRAERSTYSQPMNIYEIHLGSWKRKDDWSSLSYRELAEDLPRYLNEMGFTHLELMPITEHPFDGSWGYQTTGYFAPTSRYGSPDDFRYLVDRLHQAGIAVILDWVPAHFPTDLHGLGFFDGTHLYEHSDPRQGYHPDWSTNIFNYGRCEVRNFLLSSALFWMEQFHIDGLRIDAVASMLYLDYSRQEGEWVPNRYGGRENLEAISFIRELNELVYGQFPGVITVAEESTAWPMVSRPTYAGGLGFGFKWNMGWMNDTLRYFEKDGIHRSYHHGELTFSMIYAFNENFILPISHDEVVHGKRATVSKMPGDDWQKFANARLLFGYMYGHPGKKLLFMGNELGDWDEWNHNSCMHWGRLEHPNHQGIQRWVKDLNHLVIRESALHEVDFDQEGFQWIDCHDHNNSVLSFVRFNKGRTRSVVVVCNFTPVVRQDYRIGVPSSGYWRELLNSDGPEYWGGGIGNAGGVEASYEQWYCWDYSLRLTLPPLGVIFLTASG